MTPEEQALERRRGYNATVVYLRKPHPELMILRVRPDFPRPELNAGQYCTLGMGYWEPRHPGCQEELIAPADIPKIVRRAYSMSCSILDEQGQLENHTLTDWIEFYIVLVRFGGRKNEAPALTPRLFMLREGDRLFLGEKVAGHYTLDPVQPGDTVLFLSTGTGEAPHNFMLWDLLRRGHKGPILSACCVRYRRDLAYTATHEELMRRYPNYQYLSLTTREADTVDHKVYVQDLITSGELERRLGAALDPARSHVFLCGNPNMIGVPIRDRETGQRFYPQPLGVVEILEKRGFQLDQPQAKIKGNVHFEEYW
jgi:ferredoxin--NADP+ reductase